MKKIEKFKLKNSMQYNEKQYSVGLTLRDYDF